ncbi:MAG: helix-turn-helix domain-containing protein [Flavobacteriaceae bacterium]|jgi:AraC-like DNA-binding protein|nr:helix-turn-helix domain-containing protein [Flavobacteriaceae bacterium]
MDINNKLSLTCGVVYGICTNDTIGNYPLQLSYLTLFFVEKGVGVVSIDFKEYPIAKGSFIVVGEDNIVSFKRVSKGFSMHCYFIKRDLASEIAYVLPNELFSYLHYFPIQYFKVEDQTSYGLWQSLTLYLMTHSTSHIKQLLCNQFQNLFLTLAEFITYEAFVLEKHYSRQEELCWKFWDLISIYAKEHREVSFYAEKLFVTPYYLSQVTQQFLNYSPKELINRQVILEIKHFLKSTDLSIGQIAEQLHFVDPSYMGRFFKREVGINPLEYRKK